MPRGNIPRQPSKAGRQDRVQKLVGRSSNIPRKPKDGLHGAPELHRAAAPAKAKPAKRYNPIAPARVDEIRKRLDERYPNVVCALHHNSAWELLVATILSAQCTDVRVNMVTPLLFQKYPTPEHFAALRRKTGRRHSLYRILS